MNMFFGARTASEKVKSHTSDQFWLITVNLSIGSDDVPSVRHHSLPWIFDTGAAAVDERESASVSSNALIGRF
jgi:hypothetical protein